MDVRAPNGRAKGPDAVVGGEWKCRPVANDRHEGLGQDGRSQGTLLGLVCGSGNTVPLFFSFSRLLLWGFDLFLLLDFSLTSLL